MFANNNLTTPLHDIVSSTPLKGENRDRLSKLIAEKGNVFAYTQTRNESSSAEINSLNDTSCISPSVLRKVASESNHSLNFEDIKQAILNRKMQEFNYYLKIPSFIRNIVQEPYSVYYYLESQLQSFCTTSASSSWEHPATVCVDTSGDIFPPVKSERGRKKFYNFAVTLSTTEKKFIPIAEMLSVTVNIQNVSMFLENFVCDLQKFCKTSLKMPELFLTDLTWVNIHPLLNVFLKTTIDKYLKDKYIQFKTEQSSSGSVLLVDKLHTIKFILQKCGQLCETYIAETFLAVFLYLLMCRTKENIEDHFRSLVNVFGSKYRKREHEKVLEKCSKFRNKWESSNCQDMDDKEEYVNQEKDFIKKLPIRKSSDFYTYFREIYEEEQMKMTNDDDDTKEPNSFFAPDLLDYVTLNYLSLFPLFSLYFVPDPNITELPTTSDVENNWKNIKSLFKGIPIRKRSVPIYFSTLQGYYAAEVGNLPRQKGRGAYKQLQQKVHKRTASRMYSVPTLGKEERWQNRKETSTKKMAGPRGG